MTTKKLLLAIATILFAVGLARPSLGAEVTGNALRFTIAEDLDVSETVIDTNLASCDLIEFNVGVLSASNPARFSITEYTVARAADTWIPHEVVLCTACNDAGSPVTVTCTRNYEPYDNADFYYAVVGAANFPWATGSVMILSWTSGMARQSMIQGSNREIIYNQTATDGTTNRVNITPQGADYAIIDRGYLGVREAATPTISANSIPLWAGQRASGMPRQLNWIGATDPRPKQALLDPYNYATACWNPVSTGFQYHGTSLLVAAGGVTMAVAEPANTSAYTRRIKGCQATAATAGVGGRIDSSDRLFRGVGYPGFLATYYGVSTLQFGASGELLIGVGAAINTTTDPSAHINYVGFTTDPGEARLHIRHNDGAGTATDVDCGVNFPVNTTAFYDLTLYAPYNSSTMVLAARRLDSSTTDCTATITTNLPADGLALQVVQNFNTGASGGILEYCQEGGCVVMPREIP